MSALHQTFARDHFGDESQTQGFRCFDKATGKEQIAGLLVADLARQKNGNDGGQEPDLHFGVTEFRFGNRQGEIAQSGDATAARAELRYSVQRPLRGASLVLVELVTGLQNQIRVQFSAIGHPVVGDRKYHPAEAAEHRIARVALHASHLEFTHPRTGRAIIIDSRPPADFQSLLRTLA